MGERVAVLMETQDGGGEDGSEEPALGALYNASIMGRIATGPNAGRRVKTLGQSSAAEDSGEDDSCQSGTLRCAMVSGFSVHARMGIRRPENSCLKCAVRPAAARPSLHKAHLCDSIGGRYTGQPL